MARFTRERTATLSDGSVITFRRPRLNNIHAAQGAWMKNAADSADALKARLSETQLVEFEQERKDRRERSLKNSPPVQTSTPEEDRDEFPLIDHATLVNETVISWKYGEEDAVEVSSDDSNPYEDVDADVLKEAARAIYDAYVGRKNS